MYHSGKGCWQWGRLSMCEQRRHMRNLCTFLSFFAVNLKLLFTKKVSRKIVSLWFDKYDPSLNAITTGNRSALNCEESLKSCYEWVFNPLEKQIFKGGKDYRSGIGLNKETHQRHKPQAWQLDSMPCRQGSFIL